MCPRLFLGQPGGTARIKVGAVWWFEKQQRVIFDWRKVWGEVREVTRPSQGETYGHKGLLGPC